MSSRADTLALLIAAIREEGPHVLAAPEDADYFRQAERKNPPIAKELAALPREIISSPKSPPVLKSPENKPEPLPKKEPPPLPLKKEDPPSKPKLAPVKEELPKASIDFSSLRTLLAAVAPELAILPDLPSDHVAKKISERWKTKNQTAPLSLLYLHEPKEQRALLEQIAKALDIYFGPAKLVNAEGIEKENQWGAFLSVAHLKLVIVCDYTLWQLNGLMSFYKETPAQGARVLGNTPLFLLPDLSLYLKDPLLKRSLWKALCQKCS